MKIAVIGLYYDPNLGDAIICDCVLRNLQEDFPGCRVDLVDIQGRTAFSVPAPSTPEEQRRQARLQRKARVLTALHLSDLRERWVSERIAGNRDFYAELSARNYDLAIFAGGQLFMDWLAPDVTAVLHALRLSRTPVMFNACGTGTSISPGIRRALKQALSESDVRLISCRDHTALLQRRFLPPSLTAVSAPDGALWAAETYGIAHDADSDVIGLGVMHTGQIAPKRLERLYSELMDALEQQGLPFRLFTNGDPNDYALARALLAKRGADADLLLPRPTSPEQLTAQIASLRGMISLRLHSHILAAALNVPAVAVVWDEKLTYFYHSIGHSERCLRPTVDGAAAVQALLLALSQGYDRREIQAQKDFGRSLLRNFIEQEFFHGSQYRTD